MSFIIWRNSVFYSKNISKFNIFCKFPKTKCKKLRVLITIIFIIYQNLAFSQSYLGWITNQVNFRSQPDKSSEVISSLKAGTQIFIISSETENDFYNIIDINTNTEGYVHKSFVKLGDYVPKSNGGLFSPDGSSSSYNPEVSIYNNTSKTLTLKLNSEVYSFSPSERKTITISPGIYDYRASAPGVLPNIGSESLRSNTKYSWKFYIQTKWGY